MKKLFAFALVLLAGSLFAGDYVCKVVSNKKDCRFQSGETFTVKAILTKSGKKVTEGKLRCVVKWEGKIVKAQKFDLAKQAGKAVEMSYKGTKPGWVLFSYTVYDKNGQIVSKPAKRVMQFTKPDVVTEIGAIFDGEKITTNVPCPADFEAYWRGITAKIQAAPLNPELKEVPCKVAGVKLYSYLIKCECGTDISGYLAIPAGAKPGTLPLVVSFQSLSSVDVRSDPAVSAAKDGAVGLAASWHGLPVKQPAQFYKTSCRKYYKDLLKSTSNRERWHFRSVYLRVIRTLTFAKSRPEWNKKDLVVRGGSLGGAQTIIASALDKDVTLAAMQVPCYCEFNGEDSGHKNSIPFQTGDLKSNNINREMSPADKECMAYFDMVNFARLIKCECYFATGFVDELCPPSNVFAAYNNVPAGVKKSIFTNPMSGHYGSTKDLQGQERLRKFFGGIKVQRYTGK